MKQANMICPLGPECKCAHGCKAHTIGPINVYQTNRVKYSGTLDTAVAPKTFLPLSFAIYRVASVT